MQVGDRVYYVGKQVFLEKNKIYTITYIMNGHIYIFPFDGLGSTIPLYDSKDFKLVSDFRKKKITRIKNRMYAKRG